MDTRRRLEANVSTLGVWGLWFAVDWHWAMVIGAILLLVLFGVVGIVIESDGDWWIF
jgi:hypothetical protein